MEPRKAEWKRAMNASRLAVNWFCFVLVLLMSRRDQTRKVKPRPTNAHSDRLMLVCAVVFAVLLLLLRMLVFVHGHGRR
jgi:hypothetical protein